jgi:hypothetical protein
VSVLLQEVRVVEAEFLGKHEFEFEIQTDVLIDLLKCSVFPQLVAEGLSAEPV